MSTAWCTQGRTLQTRLDCSMARKNSDKGYENCAGAAPGTFNYPFCYIVDDGWDAMEGSVSGDGCRPTIGAMKYGDALAIAELATELGDGALAATYTQRAAWIQEEYLKLLWNEGIQFFAVYKENIQGNGKFHCANGTSSTQVTSSSTEALASEGPHPPGCPIEWACNKPADVRELLGLGPPYYFHLAPTSTTGATKYDVEWKQLSDPQGFKAEFGPTTVERRSKCFNQTLDGGECNWAGPSWPYETARVLTGLANFLIDYPKAQSKGAGVGAADFTSLLRTYARSHTRSSAVNGGGLSAHRVMWFPFFLPVFELNFKCQVHLSSSFMNFAHPHTPAHNDLRILTPHAHNDLRILTPHARNDLRILTPHAHNDLRILTPLQ